MTDETQTDATANLRGIGLLVLAMFVLPLQDIAIKWIGGDYPVLEIAVYTSCGVSERPFLQVVC
ncbi:MAG: hypothetical protein ACK2UK_10290 [Candidatus Promineifilaceae bacterium]